MKKMMFIAAILLQISTAYGQLTGVKTVPGDYTSITSAIADLNTQGVGLGGIIFNIAAGYTETISARLAVTATGTEANPVVFKKNGTGNNPLVKAYIGTMLANSSAPDGIWSFVGCDFITIDGIDLLDPSTNTTPVTQMEYGYGFFKASATNGANNNAVRNCTITLNRANNATAVGPFYAGSAGIVLLDCLPTSGYSFLKVTETAGASSNNRFVSNVIQNVNCGINLNGYAGSPNYELCDTGNDIGGSGDSTGNTIKNFGGATATIASACGIFIKSQWNFNVSHNVLLNNDGTGSNHPGPIFGIQTIETSLGASGNITHNTLTIKGGSISQPITLIENRAGSSGINNTININHNTIVNCTNDLNTSGDWYGICNSGAAAQVNICDNVFSNNSDNATTAAAICDIYSSGNITGTLTISGNQLSHTFSGSSPFSSIYSGIYNSGGTTATSVNINTNTFAGYSFTTQSSARINFIYNSASVGNLAIDFNSWSDLHVNNTGNQYLICNNSNTQASLNINSNSIITGYTRLGPSGLLYGYFGSGSSPINCQQNISGNNFSNITSATLGSGNFYGIYSVDGTGNYPSLTLSGNTISDIIYNSTGSCYGLYVSKLGGGFSGTPSGIFSNTINEITCAGPFFGIYTASATSMIYPVNIYSNVISNLNSSGSSSDSYGCYLASALGGINFYQNKVFGLQSTGATADIYGIDVVSATTYNIYNNFISDLNNTFSAPDNTFYAPLVGLHVESNTAVVNLFNNTVFLNASGTGPNFSSACLYVMTAATVNLRNNIFTNLSTPGSTGYTVAYWRSNYNMSTYAGSSNNNAFFAGIPDERHLLFYNFNFSGQTLSDSKTYVSPREYNSVAELPPFVNISISPYDLHLQEGAPTQCESAGGYITSPLIVNTDYDGDCRQGNTGYSGAGTAPDVGADEFGGTPLDVTPPTISFTPVSYQCGSGGQVMLATILDASGVPVSGIGLPVLYYKVNSSAWSPQQGVPAGNSQYTFSFGSALTPGDVVSYYICAQDLASTPNIGSNSPTGAGNFTANPPAAAIHPANPNTYTVLPSLSGLKTIGPGGDFATVAAAITTLNNSCIGEGGVIFTIPAGYTETFASATAGLITNNNGAETSPVIFRKTGTGAHPLITSAAGTGSYDGIIVLAGTDYITFDSISVRDNPSNTSSITRMEWGFALVKRNASSPFDGCQHVTIQNCSITLNKAHTSSVGIYAGNHKSTGGSLSIASPTDAMNNCRFLGNVISNVYTGISINGYSTSYQTWLYDQNNSIGSAGAGNIISNYGGSSVSSYGIDAGYQNDIKICNNSITSATGTTQLLYGIYTSSGINSNVDIQSNTITLTGSSTSNAIYGIRNGMGESGNDNIINISNNVLMGCNHVAATSGVFYGIYNNASPSILKIRANAFSSNATSSTTGAVYLIYNSGSAINAMNLNNNVFNGMTWTSANSSNNLNGIYNLGEGPSTNLTIDSNWFSNFTFSNPGTGLLNFINNRGTCANTSISNNTFNDLILNFTGTINLINHSGATSLSLNVNHNNIGTQLTRHGAAGSFAACNCTGFSPYTSIQSYSGNNFSNITCLNAGSGTFYGIYTADGTISPYPRKILDSNMISNINYNSTGYLYGIFANSLGDGNTSSGSVISNNQISEIASSAANVYGIYAGCASPANRSDILFNNISGLGSSGSGSTVYGAYLSGGAGFNVEENRIYDLEPTGTSSYAHGMYLSSGSVITLCNNLIGDIKAVNSTNIPAVNGIFIANTPSMVNLYYNSVFLNAQSSSVTNFGSSALYLSSTTPILTSRNNIFIDNSIPGSVKGNCAAFRCPGFPGIATYTIASNNNLFYAGVPSAGKLIYVEGTMFPFTSIQTLEQYKGYIGSGRDSLSVSENPSFLNVSGQDPAFLHINPAIPTLLESGAVNVASFTNDYDSEIRQGNAGYTGTGTAPDIGADEFNGIPAPPAIVFTPLADTTWPGARTLVATITDGQGIPTSGPGLPVLYWKQNSGSWNSACGISLGQHHYSFTFGATASIGDTIHYYVAAQDNAMVPDVTTYPLAGAGGFTANPPAASIAPATPCWYTLYGLSGVYHVGTGKDFSTITAAVNAYNSSYIAGPVTFMLDDATYPAETFPVTIGPNPGSGPSNILTIKPAPGIQSTISGNVSTAILKFSNAKFVILDGSNNANNDRSLTIINTSTSGTRAAIWVGSNGPELGSGHLIIKNCNLANGSAVNSNYGIFIGASSGIGTRGYDNDNLTIQNNAIFKSNIAIRVYANNPGTSDSLIVKDNLIGSDSTTEYLSFKGILIAGASSPEIRGNRIFNIISSTLYNNICGIDISDNVSNAVIKQNEIHDLQNNTAGGYGAYGINISSANNVSSISMINNIIYKINTINYSGGTTYGPFGIRITGGSGHKIFFNSVNMSGSQYASGNAGTLSAALCVNSYSVTGIDVRNNIFANGINGLSGSRSYGIYAVSNTNFGTIDYNDYYGYGADGLLGYLSGDIYTIANWSSATGQDANSGGYDPEFLSAIDLRPSVGSAVLSSGTAITEVNTDFLNMVRNNPPAIGAYENGADVSGPEIVFIPFTATNLSSARTLTATITDFSGVPVSGPGLPTLYWKINQGNWMAVTAVSLGGNQYQFSFGEGAAPGDVVSYYIMAQDQYIPVPVVSCFPAAGAGAFTINPPGAGTPPVQPASYNVLLPLCGTFTVGAGQNYPTLTDAINDLNSKAITCPVTFLLMDETYSSEILPITINDNLGSSATNTVTIKPGAAVRPAMLGASATSLIKINGSSHIIIDGSNNATESRDLSFINQSASENTAGIWIGNQSAGNSSSHLTIKNCNISNNSTENHSYGIFAGSSDTIGIPGAYIDTLVIQNNNIMNSYTGIGAKATVTGFIEGLQIIDNSIGTNSGNSIGHEGILLSYTSGSLILQNTLVNIGSFVPNPSGIRLMAGVANTVIGRNSISGVEYTGVDGSGATGIDINSGSLSSVLTLSNNAISGILADGNTSHDSTVIAGIRIWGTTGGIQVYFNSVNLGGTIAIGEGHALSAAIYTGAQTSDITLIDNIFVNTITKPALLESKTYAIYHAGNYSGYAQINYNDYYANGSQAILGYLEGEKPGLLQWQSATGQDEQSVSIDPMFNSPVVLRPLLGSPAVGAGITIPTIITDISGTIRNTPPSLGAYENAGDATGPMITYALLPNTTSLSPRTLLATITDNTGVPSSGAGLPVLYWKVNAGAWNVSTAFSLGAGQYQFQFGDGVTTGDIVYYFIVAQDNNQPVPVISVQPPNGAAGLSFNPPAVSVPPSFPDKYTVCEALSGVKTVGTGGDYPSLTGQGGLFYDINNRILSGNLTALIITDLIEDGSNDLKEWGEETGSNFTLTIQPGSATEKLITGSVQNGMIRLNGPDRVTFDGRYGGIGKNLRFRNTNNNYPAFIISNGALLNTIQSCCIEGANFSSNPGHAGLVLFSGTEGITGNDSNLVADNVIRNRNDNQAVPRYLIYSFGNPYQKNSFNTISNNELLNFDLSAIKITATGNGDGWSISGNSLYMNLNRSSSFTQIPIDLQSGSNANSISDNFIGGNAPLCGGGYWENGADYSFTGINVVAGYNTPTSVQNNTITKIKLTNTSSSGSFKGINANGGWVNIGTITGNAIGSLSTPNSIVHSGSGSSIAIRVNCWSTISNNTIGNVVVNNPFACKNNVGIHLSGNYSTTIDGNKIKNIGPDSDAKNTEDGWSWPTCGIIVYSAGNLNKSYTIANNDISLGFDNLRHNFSIYGIWVAADTGTYHVYYNSVNIGGVTDDNDFWEPTTSHWSSALLIAVNSLDPDTNGYLKTPDLYVKDNVFTNQRINGYERDAFHLPIVNTRQHYYLLSNYNDLYRENGPVGYINGDIRNTLYDWQIATSGQDTNSICADPLFNDSTNLIPLSVSPVMNAGIPIAGITKDILGTIRSNSAPSLGAYEEPGDFYPPEIVYTPLGNTAILTSRTLIANISDLGSGVPVSGTGLPRLYWKINSGLWNVSTAVYLVGNQYQFAFGDGVSLGDIVSYYVVAQDNNTTPLVSCNPAAGSAGFSWNPPAVSTPPVSPDSYTIKAPICGIIAVGAGQTYTTLTNAVNDLNNKIITCPVTFLLTDNTYPFETFPITFNANVGSSVVNTVTVKPAAGVNPAIEGTSFTAVIKFNGASHMIIDGSNCETSTRNLTIRNLASSGTNAAIWVGSNGKDAGSTFITIRNCLLSNGSNSNYGSHGIIASSSSNIGSYYNGYDNDNLTIENNVIIKSYTAIAIYGSSSGVGTNDTLIIKDNIIGSDTPASYIGCTGINIYSGANSPNIAGNKVFNIISSNVSVYGILIQYNVPGAIIEKNEIHDIRTASEESGSYGLYLYNYEGNSDSALIKNNLIYNINKSNYSSLTSSWATGIYIYYGAGYRLYYNTIALSGSQNSSASIGQSAALYLNNAYNCIVKNNVLVNGIIGVPGSKSYGIYSRYSSFEEIDYNNYCTFNPYGILGYFYGDKHTIAEWRMTTGQDTHSGDQDPQLNSATNLRPQPSSPVIGAGTVVAGVTTDFLNVIRNIPPSIGAYELGVDESGPVISYTPLQSTNLTTGRTLIATITDYSGVPISGEGLPALYWKINTGTWITSTALSLGGSLYQFEFGSGVSMGDVVSYYIVAQDKAVPAPWVSCNPAVSSGGFSTNPPASAVPPETPETYTIKPPICGNFEVGAGKDYETITSAIADLNNKILTCPVIFYLTDQSYNAEIFPIVINANPGSSTVNIVTIRPAPGVDPVISGPSASSLIKINGADHFIIDGSNNESECRNLTIANTASTGTIAAIWIGSKTTGSGSNDITIKNTNLSNGFKTTGSYGIFVGSALTIGAPGDDNDHLTIQNNAISKSNYGIFTYGSWSGLNDHLSIKSNLIGNPVPIQSIGTEGICVNGADVVEIQGNEVFNISSSVNYNDVVGIDLSGILTNGAIKQNKIHDLTNSANSSPSGVQGAFGIKINGPDSINIVNNVIYKINTDNNYYHPCGLFIQGGRGHKIFFNSVNLSGNQQAIGTGNTWSAALCASADNLDLRNNVLVNGIHGLPGSYSYAIYGAGFDSIDYNNYFVYGPNGTLGNDFNANIMNLLDWEETTGQDLHSLNADPVFTADSNLRPDFTSPLIDAAIPIATVTRDYCDSLRNPTAPTIGAYENGVDAIGPTITLTPPGNTIHLTARTIIATISDYNGVPVSGIGLPVLYWKINSGTYTASTAIHIESNQYSFILGEGVSLYDTVYYYIVAQDNHAPEVLLSASPASGAGGFTTNPPACSILPDAPYYYRILPAISGPVTVGAGGTYPSLTCNSGFFSVINNSVVTGHLIVSVVSDLTEDGTHALNQWSDEPDGSGFILTIQPDQALRVISGTAIDSGRAMIRINGADNVNINGGSGKNLLFRNSNVFSERTGATLLFDNDCRNVCLQNCILESNGTIWDQATIKLSGTAWNLVITGNEIRQSTGGTTGMPLRAIYSEYNPTLPAGPFQINNNNISNFSYQGISLVYPADGCAINGNNFFNNAAIVSGNHNQVIYLGHGNNHSICGNFIGGQAPLCGGAKWEYSEANFYGIFLEAGSRQASTVQNNIIQNINFSDLYNFYGIYISTGLVNVGTVSGNTVGSNASAEALIYNSPNTTSSVVNGIYIGTGLKTDSRIENNIVCNLTLNNLTGYPEVNGLYTNSGCKIRNNKIMNVSATYSSLTPVITGIRYDGYADSEITNNLVSLDGGNSLNPTLYGFLDNGYGSLHLYFNDFTVSGPAVNSSSTYALYSYGYCDNILKNNILSNTRLAGGPGKHYAVYRGSGSGTWTSDYNDLYSFAGPLGFYTSDILTMADWRTLSSGDFNSVNVDPQFVSSTDLHTTRPELNGAGLYISSVTTDYAGILRSNPPDIGAYEFNAFPLILNIVGNLIITGTQCYDAMQTINVAGGANTFTVADGGNVTLIAGQNIICNPGISVQPGGYLHAYISNNFCGTNQSASSLSALGTVETCPEIIMNSAFFRVYPNPTMGSFTVELSDQITDPANTKIELFDMFGRRLLVGQFSGQRQSFSILEKKPTGIYSLRLISGNNTDLIKIIKQ